MAYMTYYKSQLTEKEKNAYEAFIDGVCERKELIELPHITSDEMNRIYFALNYDYPDFFIWIFCSFNTLYTLTR